MSVVSELNDRVRSLTCGYVPDDADGWQILHGGAILIIQRNPQNISHHRVARLGSTISVQHLRSLVCASWRPDEINP